MNKKDEELRSCQSLSPLGFVYFFIIKGSTFSSKKSKKLLEKGAEMPKSITNDYFKLLVRGKILEFGFCRI